MANPDLPVAAEKPRLSQSALTTLWLAACAIHSDHGSNKGRAALYHGLLSVAEDHVTPPPTLFTVKAK